MGQSENAAEALTTAGTTKEVICTACESGKFATATDASCATLTGILERGVGNESRIRWSEAA